MCFSREEYTVIINGMKRKIDFLTESDVDIRSINAMEEVTPAVIKKHFFEIFGSLPYMNCYMISLMWRFVDKPAIDFLNNQRFRVLGFNASTGSTPHDIQPFFSH
uniref:Uncharacterized protein n=1 Tax=Caenorhabditis japonica TaxID=281687 RepID=A0A8R1ICB7_CAEJA